MKYFTFESKIGFHWSDQLGYTVQELLKWIQMTYKRTENIIKDSGLGCLNQLAVGEYCVETNK